MMMALTTACEYNMGDVWKCANSGRRFRNNCLTPGDIHQAVRTRASFFARPIILHREGIGLRKLFEDCDGNHDRCIEPSEAMKLAKCQRSCKWKRVWIKTFCE